MQTVISLAIAQVPKIGICVRRDCNATPAQDDVLLAMIQGVGARVVRMTLDWAQCERQPGAYTWGQYESFVARLRAAGVLPLLIVQQGNPLYTGTWDKLPTTAAAQTAYGAFIKAAITKFGINSCWYEILNEANNPGYGGGMTGAQYGALVNAVTAAVRPNDSWSYLLTCGPSYHDKANWLADMRAVADLSKVTALGDHPYTGGDVYWRNDPACRAEGMAAMLQQTVVAAGGSRLAWNTEAGVSVTECDGATWADKVVRQGVHAALFVLASLMVGTRQALSCWYCLQDRGTDQADREQSFGLFDAAGNLKPSGRQFAAMMALVNAASSILIERDGNLYRATFTPSSGVAQRFLWSSSGTQNYPVSVAVNEADAPRLISA